MGRVYKRVQQFERLTLTAPMEERSKWVAWCYQRGWTVLRTGPKYTSWNNADLSRIRIVAERRVK